MENNVEEVFKAASTCATPPARVAPGEYMWDKLTWALSSYDEQAISKLSCPLQLCLQGGHCGKTQCAAYCEMTGYGIVLPNPQCPSRSCRDCQWVTFQGWWRWRALVVVVVVVGGGGGGINLRKVKSENLKFRTDLQDSVEPFHCHFLLYCATHSNIFSLHTCFAWCSSSRSWTLNEWELRTWNLGQIFEI